MITQEQDMTDVMNLKLPRCCVQVKSIELQPSGARFSVIQDDLLHPVLGGNKRRKLDALLPWLAHQGFTDIVNSAQPNGVF